jgi:peptidoglycan/LPS O-acetylase OafA/YrhL
MEGVRRDGGHPCGFDPSGFEGLAGGRDNGFDLVRFALAVLVILSHSWPLLQGNNGREPLSRLSGGQVNGGHLAVDLFFVVSGFLISMSWTRSPSARAFLCRRAARIYPGFAVAVLVAAVWIGPWLAPTPSIYWARFQPLKFAGALPALQTCVPNTFPHLMFRTLNGSLWTIPYEFKCYLGVMVLGWFGGFRRRRVILGLFVIAWGVYATQVQLEARLAGSGWAASAQCWPRFVTSFLAGTVAYAYRERIPDSSRLLAIAVIGLVVLAGLPGLALLAPMVPVLGGYAALWLAAHPGRRLAGFGRHGDYSYGVYLYAFPVQQLVVRWVGVSRLTPPLLFVLALPLMGLLALGSWWPRSVSGGSSRPALGAAAEAGAGRVRWPSRVQS